MEFMEIVRDRFSCKKFNGRAIKREELDIILEAGRLAPTAKNLQEQKIYVVESKEGLEKIDELTPCRYNAPIVVIVAYDKNNTYIYPGEKYNSGIEDAAIVLTHMTLAAKSVGVDSCIVNFFDPDKAREVFDLPENEEIIALLDLGYPAEDAKPLPNHEKRKSIEETVKFL